jgi:undecaprenyl-diphosphatase
VTPARNHLKPALAAGALVLIWLAMLLVGAGSVDRAIMDALYVGQQPVLANATRLVTHLGGGTVVTLVTAAVALVLALRRQPWPALVLIVGTAIGRLFVQLQKYQLSRTRPDENPHLVDVYSLSFPSGHSANSVMAYVTIALLLAANGQTRWIWLGAAAVLSFLIGLSRVMLGVHWPSDVVGGWSFGLLWSLLIYAISRTGWRKGRVA